MRLVGTLVADGSSDRLLKPILEWLLSQHLPPGAVISIQVPDWGRFQVPVAHCLPVATSTTKYGIRNSWRQSKYPISIFDGFPVS